MKRLLILSALLGALVLAIFFAAPMSTAAPATSEYHLFHTQFAVNYFGWNGTLFLQNDANSTSSAQSALAESLTAEEDMSLPSYPVPHNNGVNTWTHELRSDWELGTYPWLDTVTVSGTLQLMTQYFSGQGSVTALADLHFHQQNPSLAVDADGNAYSVWIDRRNGKPDLYFSYRPAGGTWGAAVRVNDDTSTTTLSSPGIAVDNSGNVYIVWVDWRNGDADIYFAVRDGAGIWSANERVNDDFTSAHQGDPSLAVDNHGNVYAAWTDARHGNNDIYFARRTTGGGWSANEKVNDDVGSTDQSAPSIAVDNAGLVYALWVDSREGNRDIYFALRSSPNAWGVNTKVNDDTGITPQFAPALGVDGAGNAYAVWQDRRNDSACTPMPNCRDDIYFAYRPAGGAWGANVQVNDLGTNALQGWPSIAVDSNGTAHVAWLDCRGAGTSVFCGQIYGATQVTSNVWSANVKISDNTAAFYAGAPSIAVDSGGNSYVIWPDRRPDVAPSSIYFAYRPAQGAWGANSLVADDGGPISWQDRPRIAADPAGNNYVAWYDYSNRDIFYAYQPFGGVWGNAEKVNDATSWAGNPAIAADPDGNAYLVMLDTRSAVREVYFSYRPAGGTWSPNVKVNDTVSWTEEPDIAVDNDGNAYAIWADYRNGNYDIYFAYRPAGGNWGTNSKVNDDGGTTRQGTPRIAVDGAGNAYAVWTDERNGNRDVYFAYRPSGGVWGANVKLNDDLGTTAQSSPDIAVTAAGHAYAVWRDEREGVAAAYFAERPVGGAWSSNVKISDRSGFVGSTNVAVDGTGVVLALWSQNGVHFAKRPAGGVWQASSRVDYGSGVPGDTPHFAVASNGQVTTVWRDYRYNSGAVFAAQSAPGLPYPYYLSATYTSPILDTGVTAAQWGSMFISAHVPASTSLTIESRSRLDGGAWSLWQPVSGAINSAPGRYFQYRVHFQSASGDATPQLDRLEITYVVGAETEVGPDQAASLAYTDGAGTAINVDIPAGAVQITTTLVLLPASVQAAPPGMGFVAGTAFDLIAYRDGALLARFTFELPVTVRIEYLDENVTGLEEATLTLRRWTGNIWLDAACGEYERNLDENWVAAPICHLSRFALFGEREEGDFSIFLPSILRQ